MWIRLPKQQPAKLLPVPQKNKNKTMEVQTNNYIQKFRYNYKDKAHDNHTTTNIYHKQRLRITNVY